jgi:predicted SAM-dependent methyltransferase
MKKVKLHLGSGGKHLDEFINVDIREDVNPDLIDDIAKLHSFKDKSVDLIYVCHTLEHFGRHEYMEVLERWFQLLKPGGILRISLPDFEKIVEYYNETGDVTKLIGLLYGGQTYAQNYHYITWDFQSLKNDLLKVGFKTIERYDWRETEHADIDDFSQSYLPHMDKDNGKLMSLNVEATK